MITEGGRGSRVGSGEEEHLEELFSQSLQRKKDEEWGKSHGDRDTLMPKYEQAISGDGARAAGDEMWEGAGSCHYSKLCVKWGGRGDEGCWEDMCLERAVTV